MINVKEGDGWAKEKALGFSWEMGLTETTINNGIR